MIDDRSDFIWVLELTKRSEFMEAFIQFVIDVHSQMGGNGLGVAPGELPAIYDDVDIFVQPGAPEPSPEPSPQPPPEPSPQPSPE